MSKTRLVFIILFFICSKNILAEEECKQVCITTYFPIFVGKTFLMLPLTNCHQECKEQECPEIVYPDMSLYKEQEGRTSDNILSTDVHSKEVSTDKK
jgi:hypothetical protein